VHWPCRMAQTWVTSMVKESKHFLRRCLGALIGPWSLALTFGHDHSSYDTGNRVTVAKCTLF